MRILLISFLSILLAKPAMAQDVILTMSGYEIPCKILEKEGFEIRFEMSRKNGKLKEKNIHISEIFSVTQNGVEEVYYVQDPILGDDLSVQEMRIYIAGQQDARENFKTWPTFVVGATLGAGMAIIAAGGFMATLAVPIVYPVAQLIPVIKIRQAYISDPNHRYNEIYAAGFERVARTQKIMAGLKGAFIGTAVGLGVFYVILGGEEN